MDPAGNIKIRVKVGDSEFESEGPAATVDQQYEKFLAAVAKANSTAAPQPALEKRDGFSATVHEKHKNPIHHQIDAALLKRIFAENDSVISLLALPKSDTVGADAILLLIYGYQAMRQNDYPVTGVRLMQAVKQSGLQHQVDRIDRTIAAHASLILQAGTKRGRKYSLNNQGVAKAEEIVRSLLG